MELLLFFFGRCLSAVRSKRVHSRPGAVPAQNFHLFQMELVSLFDLAPLSASALASAAAWAF